MNFLANFYKLLAGTDKSFHIACRYHFFISMTFDGVKLNYDKSLFDLNNLGYLVQSVNLPNMQIKAGEYGATNVVNTDVGTFAYPGLNSRTIPEVDQNMVINFLDTEYAIFEYFFIPWLRMVTSYRTTQSNQNFLRANIYVDIFDNMNDNICFEYIVKGAYPVFVSTPDLTYAKEVKTTREVRFSFNDLVLQINRKPAINMEANLAASLVGLKPSENLALEASGETGNPLFGQIIKEKNNATFNNEQYQKALELLNKSFPPTQSYGMPQFNKDLDAAANVTVFKNSINNTSSMNNIPDLGGVSPMANINHLDLNAPRRSPVQNPANINGVSNNKQIPVTVFKK